MTQYTQEEIIEIAALPATAFKFKAHVDTLVDFYRWIRSEWTKSAQIELKQKHHLDLRTKRDRLKFAWLAAQELATDRLPPSTSDSDYPKSPDPEVKTTKILCQAIALLPYTPTNGIEHAPAWRIMGSPISADSLIENYKILARKWHPDFSSHPESAERFQVITNIYKTLKGQWFQKYSPLIPKEQFVDKNGNQNFNQFSRSAYSFTPPYSPESFWL